MYCFKNERKLVIYFFGLHIVMNIVNREKEYLSRSLSTTVSELICNKKQADPNPNGSMSAKGGHTSPQSNHEDPVCTSTPSILSDLQLQSTETDEIAEMPDYENLSTSAVLHYCKYKILRPYLRLLGVMGLRPTSSDESEHCSRYCILANLHTVQVTIFMCIGYVLQYMACFRRDRGFCYKLLPIEYEMISNVTEIRDYEQACYGNIIFSYLIPSILHLTAYLYTVYLFRIKENEQLQNLMERAFLLSSNLVNRGNQKRLVKILWLFIGLGIVWMIATSITVNLMMAQETILFQWLEQRYKAWKHFLSSKFLNYYRFWEIWNKSYI